MPELWDRKTDSIVSNESADIVRMLNREFDALADRSADLCPDALRDETDEVNAYVYDRISNGVAAFDRPFEGPRLAGRRPVDGADIRLFTTLLRFDAVYYTHFKCNRRRIRDYANLPRLAERLPAVPAIAAGTCTTSSIITSCLMTGSIRRASCRAARSEFSR